MWRLKELRRPRSASCAGSSDTWSTSLVDNLLTLALVLAVGAVLLAVTRLVRGPTAADRAVALDVLTLIFVPGMVALAVWSGRKIYLDVAPVYGVLSFLGVMSLARYFDRGL
ncbi:cation:proton antiporter [bacterium]|nr:cation:proton antiporter [bacterium]